jgi:ribonuclease P protein component
MLPRRYRLRHATDLQRVRRHGRRWRHPLAILLVSPAGDEMIPQPQVSQQNGRPPSRFAFAAGRRVGPAVARNRAKRLLREAVRSHLGDIEPGWDCLLIARHGSADATYLDLQTAVTQLLSRARLVSYPLQREGSPRS